MKNVIFNFAGIGYSLELEKKEIEDSIESCNFLSGFPVTSPFKKSKDKDNFFGFVGFSGL